MLLQSFGKNWLGGLAWGLGSLSALWLLLVLSGAMQWQAPNSNSPFLFGAIAMSLATGTGVALLEEALFRAFLLQHLWRAWPKALALCASSGLYALAHFGQMERFQQPSLAFAGLFAAGVVLGIGAIKRGWSFSWGLHAGWLWLFLPADSMKCWRPMPGLAWWHGAGYPLGSVAGLAVLLAMLLAWKLFWQPKPAEVLTKSCDLDPKKALDLKADHGLGG